MKMDDDSWAKHSNPWSVYTRFTLLPLISISFYSQHWIGCLLFQLGWDILLSQPAQNGMSV
ncbi:DUF6653 family protein [Vibrio sp. F74]|uniref:DUF6653 family protein n=1 Tax=Vibrio sp. F74 TaxID=700020 RepID=UPI0035F5D8DB